MKLQECQATHRHWLEVQESAPAGWTIPRGGYWSMAWYVLHFYCVRCGTWRHDAIDAVGGVLSRDYTHPDGYLLSEGEKRPTSDDFRLWQAQEVRKRARAGRKRRKAA